MKVYLVGGAVRDRLLGLPVKERDWVVVGARPQDLIDQGYRPVGKDFPVFLHPVTKEEYALARTERKTAPGYKGFAVWAAPDVSLEEDLKRRDLTINALAQDDSGRIIDPYGGLADLRARILRHVSPAFAEDPVRILRVARFAARLKALGFRVAEQTLALMRQMVSGGEVDALVPERVWQELVRALGESSPGEFFVVLRHCGALSVLLPELNGLWGVPQRPWSHPEIDTGVHTLMVLDQARRATSDPEILFSSLMHDIGKGLTPKTRWPDHPDHEAVAPPVLDALCARLRTPKSFRELARIVASHHLECHRIAELSPDAVLDLLGATDAFRRPQRFRKYLMACEADYRGRLGWGQRAYPQAGVWLAVLEAARSADITGPNSRPARGAVDIASLVRRHRLEAVVRALSARRPQ